MGMDGGGVWNFAWVDPGRLAGMAWPDPEAWPTLLTLGVGAVLSLTEAAPPGDPRHHGLAWRRLPIADFGVPDDEDLVEAVRWAREMVAADRPVVVHCRAGRGRTGMVLAAILAADGVPAAEAIARVRALRPGSIETGEQAALVERVAVRIARERAGRSAAGGGST